MPAYCDGPRGENCTGAADNRAWAADFQRHGADNKQQRCAIPTRRNPHAIYSAALRRRRALAITETELKLMAALASMGLSSQPKNGYKRPAAMGIPSVL